MTLSGNLGLAEKYRPRSLNEIEGQEHIVSSLADQIHRRVGRGILLWGRAGCGKSSLAAVYAAGLLCGSGLDRPCNSQDCESCEGLRIGNNLNFYALRHGAEDIQFAMDINSVGNYGSGAAVVLIDQAQLMSKRAFEMMHEQFNRPSRGVTHILCVEELETIPKKTRDLFWKLQVRAPNVASGRKYLDRLCRLESIPFEAGAFDVMVQFGGGSFRALGQDLELISSRGAITLENVAEHYSFGRAADYVDLAFREASFEEQLRFLSEWNEEEGLKIRQIGSYLAELFEMAACGPTAWSRALQLIEGKQAKLGDIVARGASRLRTEPRVFARKLLEIWSEEPRADKPLLLRKASEFDELLGGSTKLYFRGGDPVSVLKTWREQRDRTRKLKSEQERSAKRRPVASSKSSAHYLKDAEVQKLWDSGSFMIQAHGVVLNTWISIAHEKLQLRRPKQPGELLTEFTRELRMLVDDRSEGFDRMNSLHWLYVHRDNGRLGLVTELVAHLPATNKDVVSWILNQFFRRRNLGSISEDAITIRSYRKRGSASYLRHLTLMRFLCGGVDPRSSNNRIFIKRAGIDDRRMLSPVGPKKTPQRIGVSRLLDEGTRETASEDLSILSSFDDAELRFSSGWEFAEHEYRKQVMDRRRSIEDEISRLYGGAELERRLVKFREAWIRDRASRDARRPGFNNSEN